MHWINFLHFYQPANLEDWHIKEATEKSYLRIIRALEEHPELKFTANINGCLIARWESLGYADLISRVKNLLERGQLELTGNAFYHPILPLIPLKEARAQILETENILKKHFGSRFKPKGFFFSEMAYSAKAALLAKKMGYEWAMLDEISCPGPDKAVIDENSGLRIIFRDRALSNTFVPEKLGEKIPDKTAISGTDAELYGLRYIDHTAEFERFLKNPDLKTQSISRYLSETADLPIKAIVDCSWESAKDELEGGIPYALWNNPANPIHKELWKLARLSGATLGKNKNDQKYDWARWHYVRGLASCTFWWASGKDFKESFGPLAWSPDDIERGLNDLVRSIRSLDSKETLPAKLKAEKIFLNIKKMIWTKHWTQYWKKY